MSVDKVHSVHRSTGIMADDLEGAEQALECVQADMLGGLNRTDPTLDVFLRWEKGLQGSAP